MDSEQLHEKICSGLLTAYEQNVLNMIGRHCLEDWPS